MPKVTGRQTCPMGVVEPSVTPKNVRVGMSDEDTIIDHADFDCLSWKEILSLIDDYYKVNSFLIERMS
jgi:hypothetical protein